jgi:mono/diheme cytochrome c family protein
MHIVSGLRPLLVLALAALAVPAQAGDPATGLRIARRWCAACHVVEPGQAQASADAPSFAEIARRRGKDSAGLSAFLMDPHPKMPDMQIGRDEAASVVAYIASLQP